MLVKHSGCDGDQNIACQSKSCEGGPNYPLFLRMDIDREANELELGHGERNEHQCLGCAHEGGARNPTARRFFDNPSQSAVAEYMQKCLPLYTRRRRSPEWIALSVQNVELTSFFFQGEIRTFNLLPQLARIRCPTLVTVGDMDPITPMQNSEDLAAALPANLVRLELFKNAGHAVQRDDPEKFDRVVREFITS